jgi:hypothetical protein
MRRHFKLSRRLPLPLAVLLMMILVSSFTASGCAGGCNEECMQAIRRCASLCSLVVLPPAAITYCKDNPGKNGCPLRVGSPLEAPPQS